MDVFICYSNADIVIVEKIVRQLEYDYGWTCWYAERDLPPGCHSSLELIAEAIDKCTVFLLLSSANAVDCHDMLTAVSHAMATNVKRLELNADTYSQQSIYILNHRLHGLIKKKGTSYKDSDFVDEGINVANQIGVKALIFLFIVVVGGFVAVRAFDLLRGPQPQYMIVVEDNTLMPDLENDVTDHERAMILAEAGDISALYRLGRRYADAHNFEAAAYWYRKAAGNQHMRAILALASLLWNEDGAMRYPFAGDRVEAFLWFFRAAELGNVDMQNWIAGLYRSGAIVTSHYHGGYDIVIDGPFNIEITEHYSGSDGEEYMLRTLHIPQDNESAMYWYRRAATQGHSGAQTMLGVMYVTGEGAAENLEQGVYWYTRAARQGNSTAQGNLGIAYVLGQGVDQCYQQAAYWFRASAMQNNASAQVNLAWIYENGHAGHVDLEQSFYWNHRAAMLGNITGLGNVGLMYMQGRGVTQCYEQAIYWFRQAAARNCPRGIAYLEMLYESGYS